MGKEKERYQICIADAKTKDINELIDADWYVLVSADYATQDEKKTIGINMAGSTGGSSNVKAHIIGGVIAALTNLCENFKVDDNTLDQIARSSCGYSIRLAPVVDDDPDYDDEYEVPEDDAPDFEDEGDY